MLCFYKNIKTSNFFLYNIFTEGEYVTQSSGKARTSVWQIVCVMTNCHFMSTMWITQSFHLFCSLINIPNLCKLTAQKKNKYSLQQQH